MRWNGRIVSKQHGRVSFLLDNDLSPAIADALKLFDFDIEHFARVPEFKNRTIEDPEIIEWCRSNRRVWITHDFAARRKHAEAIKAARIHIVWLRGDPAGISVWGFFKMLVRTIDEIERMVSSAHGAIHFRLTQKCGVRPTVDWAESPQDKPKSFKTTS